MPWRPSEPGEFPTLGWYALDFMTQLLAAPDRSEYEPFIPTREQADYILRLYELDPLTCRRIVRRSVLSRARGYGKSPLVGALLITEALGDVVPDGWDADGQPAGRPWRDLRTPIAQLIGVSEDQTQNAWVPLLEMLREDAPVHDAFPDIEPLQTQVNLSGRGHIRPITSSAWTAKGGKPIVAALDQTESYFTGNGGVNLARVLRSNAAKLGGLIIETPNAFTPGENSVAETTANAFAAMQSGKALADRGIQYDHREAPPETDLGDRESLVAGLRYAYGDSSDHPDGCVIHEPPCAPGWVSIDFLVATIWDPDADEQQMRADFLNQITHASDAFVSGPQWRNCLDDGKSVKPREIITLGFDGSRGKAKGKPDATALIGCRVSDGHLFELGVWEAPDMPSKWAAWEPSIVDIEARIADAFQKYRVARFYADPAKDWRSHVNSWEAKFAGRLVKPSTAQHPFEWWMTGGRATLVERAVEQLYSGIANADITHDGSAGLTRHMLNARRRLQHGKLALGKESSYSQKKIDAAVAAVLAYQGRLDALSQGVPIPQQFYAPKRLY